MCNARSSSGNHPTVPGPPDFDVGLMLRVRDLDDAQAFEELVTRYQQRLLTVLTHWCGSRDIAEDLAQDVFLRVFRARKQYEPRAKFVTWLYTIAQRVASNSRRRLARRREVGVADPLGSSSAAIGGLAQLAKDGSRLMPTRQADQRERADAVRAAIAGLNHRQRMAVLLSKFEHMNYDEISRAMQLTPSAVKSLLSRARESLRQQLHPYLEQGRFPGGLAGDGAVPDGLLDRPLDRAIETPPGPAAR